MSFIEKATDSTATVAFFAVALLLLGLTIRTVGCLNDRHERAEQNRRDRERTPADAIPKFWR